MPEQIQPRHLTDNYILKNLSDADYALLHAHLEPAKLPLGEYVFRPDEPITHVYFPDNSMVSMIATTPEGQSVEVGVVGREGIVGIDVLMGVETTRQECLVQIDGDALRIKSEVAKQIFDQSKQLNKVLLRYVHAMMMQVSQTALCNRLHTIEQRLARWLLMCHDRAVIDTLPLTQEFLSIMLGANRPSVTNAAILLQGAGYIKYKRGKVTILEREELEYFACKCYNVVKPEYDSLEK